MQDYSKRISLALIRPQNKQVDKLHASEDVEVNTKVEPGEDWRIRRAYTLYDHQDILQCCERQRWQDDERSRQKDADVEETVLEFLLIPREVEYREVFFGSPLLLAVFQVFPPLNKGISVYWSRECLVDILC